MEAEGLREVKPYVSAGCDLYTGAVEVFQEQEHLEVVTYASQGEWEKYVLHHSICPSAILSDEEDEFPPSPVLEIQLDD